MESVIELVLATIPQVGNQTTYKELYEATPPENRRHLPNALKQLKREGKIVKWAELVDGETTSQIKREAE